MANLDQFPNIFVATLKRSLALSGSETEVYLSSIKSLDGQTINSSDFSLLGRGVLSVDVQSASRAEFVSFTGADAGGSKLTGCVRGLSFKNDAVILANKKFHAVGAPVIIAFGTHNLRDLERLIQSNAGNATVVDSNSTTSGNVAVTSLTFPLTTSGSDPAIAVQVDTTNVPSISSVTYNGIALVSEVSLTAGGLQSAQYFLTGGTMPVAGTYNVVVTLSVAAKVTAGGETLQNVNQSSPIGATASASGSSTLPLVPITTQSTNSLILDSVVTAVLPVGYSANDGQDLSWIQNSVPSSIYGASSTKSTGTAPDSTSMGYLIDPSTAWVMTAMEVKASGNDQLVRVDANDSTAGYLIDKLTSGSNISFTILNPNGDESIRIDSSGGGGGGSGGELKQTFLFSDFVDDGSGNGIATFTGIMPTASVPIGTTYEFTTAFDSGSTMKVLDSELHNGILGAVVPSDALATLTGQVASNPQTFNFTSTPHPVVVMPGVIPSQGEVTVTIFFGSGSASLFGGDGSDGALSISSGTTTIDLAGARLKILNYTSVSITGTAALAFINPHANGSIVDIKSQTGFTLTSSAAPMIDCSGLGATGGTGGTYTGAGDHAVGGNPGNDGISYGVMETNFGGGATAAPAGGAGGAVGDITTSGWSAGLAEIVGKYPQLFTGAGGGGGGGREYIGSTGTVTGGNGGRGGGCLILECAGTMDFTTANGISVAGKNGTNGAATGSGVNGAAAGGGGGGGGGSAFIFYNKLTSFTGTVNVSGGTGGNVTSTAGNNGAGGGGAGSATNAGSAGTNPVSGKSGGNGGNGLSVNAINTEF